MGIQWVWGFIGLRVLLGLGFGDSKGLGFNDLKGLGFRDL